MSFRTWVLVAGLAVAGGCKPAAMTGSNQAVDSSPIEPPLNPDPEARVGPYVIDLDGDGVVDTLTLVAFPDSEMPPAFQALQMHLSATGRDTILRGYWDGPGDAHFEGGPNLVASQAIFVARGSGGRTFIFLFGQDGIMPAQGLEVYAVSRSGVRKYYESHGFTFVAPLERIQGEVVGFRGVLEWAEGIISPHGDTLGGGSYSPTVAFRMADTITIDSVASQSLTRSALGGFAGYSPSADIAIRMRDGSRFVISSEDHRRLP